MAEQRSASSAHLRFLVPAASYARHLLAVNAALQPQWTTTMKPVAQPPVALASVPALPPAPIAPGQLPTALLVRPAPLAHLLLTLAQPAATLNLANGVLAAPKLQLSGEAPSGRYELKFELQVISHPRHPTPASPHQPCLS